MVRSLVMIGGWLLLVPLAGDAQAQERRGFWLDAGIAAGSGECTQINPLGEPRCSTDRKLGVSGHVAAGGTMTQQLLFGVDLSGWTQSAADTVRQYGLVSAVVQAYPSRSLPIYVRAGVGVGRYAEDPADDDLLSATGFAWKIGAGMELALRDGMALTPFVHFVLANDVRAKLGRVNELQDPLDYNLLQIGVGVHWH